MTFDAKNHANLCDKLEFYGTRGETFLCIKSYLGNRKPIVDILGKQSGTKSISGGVPQVLGLFPARSSAH